MQRSQLTNTVMMIAPYRFGFNADAADTNSFMQSDNELSPNEREAIAETAQREFIGFTGLLRNHGIRVVEFQDTAEPHTPDSIFPNNWISTHSDGRVVLYPMEPPNRRLERRTDIVSAVQRCGGLWKIEDLSYFEARDIFLEGTGSLVLDRTNQIAYANRSSRMHLLALKEFAQRMNFVIIEFSSRRKDTGERTAVMDSLKARHKHVVEISEAQMDEFAGNMLQVRNDAGEKFWVMSSRAYQALLPEQITSLEHDSMLLHAPLDVIELYGGGSARCMLAEIFSLES
jgi:hypothetical protein